MSQQHTLTPRPQAVHTQDGKVIYLQPQTIVDPRAMALAGGMTEIANVASAVHRLAAQIPWYVWVGATAYLVYKYGGRKV